MPAEIILCIPGPWKDRTDFIRQVITTEPAGRYMFAGMVLADVKAKDHVPLDFCPADAQILHAFEIAGQGRLSPDVISRLKGHGSVAYLHFPLNLSDQRERVLKYSQFLQRLGGIAIKVETSGIAHAWDRWFALLSGTPFDVYSSVVVLIGDKEHYYSCGMHQFGVPECEVPRSVPVGVAAELMNRFNLWQVVEKPEIATGHTFSLSAESPYFRLALVRDQRHEPDDLFHNPHGLWRLNPV